MAILSRVWSFASILCVPLVLVMFAVRIVMLPIFMQLEYARPNFAPDYYGFTAEDRLNWAPLGIAYLFSGDDALLDKQLPGEKCFPPSGTTCPMFNTREREHMRDVRTVSDLFFAAGLCAVLLLFAHAVFDHLMHFHRFLMAVKIGALTTILLIVTIAVAVVVAWDALFTTFHDLFFASGTWVFYYSDTLIRLYPEQFWMDASIAVGGIALAVAITILLLPRRFFSSVA